MIWLLLTLLTAADGQAQNVLVCENSRYLFAVYNKTLSPKNQYILTYLGPTIIQDDSQMILKFDSEVSLKSIRQYSSAVVSKLDDNYQFLIKINKYPIFVLQVFGPPSGTSIPYVRSAILNGKELCEKPKTDYFFNATETPPQAPELSRTPVVAVETDGSVDTRPILDKSCGRSSLSHTGLIVHSEPTQPGDWPWHVAIYIIDVKLGQFSLQFRCGGTLLSKTLVLTAAHCVTIGSNPVIQDSLTVVLGKYNLIGGDLASQERGVFKVIVHYEYNAATFNNDIALLKLYSEAVLDDYVQPACLWDPTLPTEDEVIGKVVGWGLNSLDMPSHTLQQTSVPIVSELKCLKSNPLFFHKRLNTKKFCGGFANGTSVCNGDSGGGLVIFVPDRVGDTSKVTGAWYVRGIVSLAVKRKEIGSICDPFMYSLFTDVDKYRGWIMWHWS